MSRFARSYWATAKHVHCVVVPSTVLAPEKTATASHAIQHDFHATAASRDRLGTILGPSLGAAAAGFLTASSWLLGQQERPEQAACGSTEQGPWFAAAAEGQQHSSCQQNAQQNSRTTRCVAMSTGETFPQWQHAYEDFATRSPWVTSLVTVQAGIALLGPRLTAHMWQVRYCIS